MKKRGISLLVLAALLLALLPAACAAGGSTYGTYSVGVNISQLSAGSTFTFGTYEQDGDPENGAEPIEWLVLSIEGDKALVISMAGLDAVPYQEGYVDVTWETCELRTWLNETFLTTAFEEDQRDAIVPVTLDNSNANNSSTMWLSIKAGNDTEDRIFQLSCQEAEELFQHRKGNNVTILKGHSLCDPTAYAIAQGAKTDENGHGYWWLRSPGYQTYYAAYVSPLSSEGATHAYAHHICIRPSFWIDPSQAVGIQLTGEVSMANNIYQQQVEGAYKMVRYLQDAAEKKAVFTADRDSISRIMLNFRLTDAKCTVTSQQLANAAYTTANLLNELVSLTGGSAATEQKASDYMAEMDKYDAKYSDADQKTVSRLCTCVKLLTLIAKEHATTTAQTTRVQSVADNWANNFNSETNLMFQEVDCVYAMARLLAVICNEFDGTGLASGTVSGVLNDLARYDDLVETYDGQIANGYYRCAELAQILSLVI